MTHHRSCRGLALLAAVATLAGGALTTVTTAASATHDGQESRQRLLGLDPLTLLLSITTATVAEVQSLIADLSPVELADALQAADPAQLTKLLAAAQLNGQLDDALATLTPAETGDLLAPLSGTDLSTALGALSTTQLSSTLATLTSGELSSVVDGLTPSQISALLDAGAGGSVIDGLLGSATALGATPGTSQIDGLLGQVTALLGGGIPLVGDQADLASLLEIVNPLLGTAGVDTSLLASLLTTANGLLPVAPAPLAKPLQDVVTTITNVLDPVLPGAGGSTGGDTTGGDTTGGGATTTGGTTTGATTPTTTGGTTFLPGRTTTLPGTLTQIAAPARPAAFRATLGKIKLSKKRTSMKFTLGCPGSAPKGCLIGLSVKIAGQKAMRTMTLALRSGRSTPVRVTFSRSVTRRLKKKGGTLKVTAKTALSTLGSASRTLKVKRPKAKRKTVKR